MRQVVRSRALWVAAGSITLAIVLLINLEPARDITHTVLGWFRVQTLELKDDEQPTGIAARTVSAAPTPSLDEVVEIVSSEPGVSIEDATPTDIRSLPFEVVTINPLKDFSGEPTRSVTTLGTVTLQLDTANLAALLAPGFPARSLARRIGTDEVTIAGGALVVTTWMADDAQQDPLTLVQIQAPLISGMPPRDLELLAELLAQALLPPIVSREFDVFDAPLVQLMLGLDVDPDASPAEPTLTDLPTGNQAVAWMHERSQLLLSGPLPPDRLIDLAANARIER